MFFANHAFILANIIYLQQWYYGKSKTNAFTLQFCYYAIYGAIILLLSTTSSTCILDVFYYLSAVKAVITVIKYVPQVLLNMKNKGTSGWSMENVILDFIGGLSSLIQAIVDAMNANDVYLIIGNPIKFMLGLISLMFDIVFIFQYFYYKVSQDSQIFESLLENSDLENENISQD